MRPEGLQGPGSDGEQEASVRAPALLNGEEEEEEEEDASVRESSTPLQHSS